MKELLVKNYKVGYEIKVKGIKPGRKIRFTFKALKEVDADGMTSFLYETQDGKMYLKVLETNKDRSVLAKVTSVFCLDY